MKTSLWIGCCLLALSALAAAETPPLGSWVPEGAQVVLEIQRMEDLALLLRDAGMELPAPPAAGAGDAADRPDWRGVRMMVAARFDWPMEAAAGGVALAFPDETRYERFCRLLPPPDAQGEKPVQAGPFLVYALPAGGALPPLPGPAAGFAAGKRVTVARGEHTVLLAFQVEAKDLVAQYVAGNRAAGATPPAQGAAEAAATVLTFRLDTRFLDKLIPLGVAKAIDYLYRPAEPTKEGAPAFGRQFFRDIPPEKVEAFLLGLGIQDWQSLEGALSRDGERYRVQAGATIKPEPHFLQRYLQGVVAKPLQAPRLLPAGLAEYGSYRLDLPLLYRLLADHARDTLGPKGEALFSGVELAVNLKLGMSLRTQLLPLLGAEYGFASWPGAELSDRVGFFIPEDPALLGVCLQALGKAGLVRSEETRLEGSTLYTLATGADTAGSNRMSLLARDGGVYVAPRRETLDRVLHAPKQDGSAVPEEAGAGCIHLTRGLSWLESAAGQLAAAAGGKTAGTTGPDSSQAGTDLAQAWQKTSVAADGLHFEASIPRAALAAWKRSLERLKPPAAPAEAPPAPAPEAPPKQK